MTEKSADLLSRKTRLDFARKTSKENSACACRARRNAGLRIVGFQLGIVCRKQAGCALRYRVCHKRGQASPGASLAPRLTATKQRSSTRKKENNSKSRSRVSNWCRKSSFGW